MRSFVLLACVALLSACGTSGVVNVETLTKPIPAGQSRLIVSRDNSLLYLAGAADVSLNGRKIASLARGGSVIEDIPAGPHIISVNAPTTFGNYTAPFEAKSGKTYSFEVSPNSKKSMLPGMALGALGEAADAQNNKNTGYFQIILIDEQ
ncbi:MAG: DUF2846 domain-containing protein [Micavibrio sp.]